MIVCSWAGRDVSLLDYAMPVNEAMRFADARSCDQIVTADRFMSPLVMAVWL
jgi:hypothetical protein